MKSTLVFAHSHSPRPLGAVGRRSGFTLFELILAIALSVTLVALIGTAINLYLARVDGSRTQVEEAQLARSILAMIADDVRATAIYQPQDTSALAAMAASGAFDVDSLDEQSGGGGGGGDVDDIDAPSGASGSSSGSGAGGGSAFGNSASGMSSGSGMAGTGGASDEPPNTMPLGLNGSMNELYVDATRLPRRDELFATVTGYTNAPMAVPAGGTGLGTNATANAATMPRPSDLKSVRYFVRPGVPVAAGSAAATSLSPAEQLRAGGLVRQEVPRRMRIWAEQMGNTTLLEAGQSLVAPEVVHIQFLYFDGTQITDIWNMLERNALPLAIEVRIWIAPTGSDVAAKAGMLDAATLSNNTRQYSQTVYLPMAEVANSAATSTSSSSQSGSSMNGMSSGSGTGFGTGSSNSAASGAGFTQP